MDRIDTQTPKGVAPGPRAQGAAPVARLEPVRAEAGATRPADVPVSSVASAGVEPPIDRDRVAEIRRAIETGRYPVVPTTIADAMIAAGLLLRVRD